MYYLNEVEHKFLTMGLRPKIRQNPVPEELRGWNWNFPPLKPYYDIKLPMWIICNNYCESGRDVYLYMVEKVRGVENHFIRVGKELHRAVAESIQRSKRLEFDHKPDFEFEISNQVWNYTVSACRMNYLKQRSEQPYASEEDVILTSIPFLVEHRMNGELLGCSGLISVDCYDYLHNMVFDLKFSSPGNFRLYTTGYALVLESLYEIPVDVGCTIYVSTVDGRLAISKDIHYIDANLRSLWIEERDRKAEIVFNEKKPGVINCNVNCIFKNYCL
jgi:CRISPR-associated protein Csa1